MRVKYTPSVLLWCNGRADWRSWKVGCMTVKHSATLERLNWNVWCWLHWKAVSWGKPWIFPWRVEREIIFGSRWADVIDSDFPAQHFQILTNRSETELDKNKMNFIWIYQAFISVIQSAADDIINLIKCSKITHETINQTIVWNLELLKVLISH